MICGRPNGSNWAKHTGQDWGEGPKNLVFSNTTQRKAETNTHTVVLSDPRSPRLPTDAASQGWVRARKLVVPTAGRLAKQAPKAGRCHEVEGRGHRGARPTALGAPQSWAPRQRGAHSPSFGPAISPRPGRPSWQTSWGMLWPLYAPGRNARSPHTLTLWRTGPGGQGPTCPWAGAPHGAGSSPGPARGHLSRPALKRGAHRTGHSAATAGLHPKAPFSSVVRPD